MYKIHKYTEELLKQFSEGFVSRGADRLIVIFVEQILALLRDCKGTVRRRPLGPGAAVAREAASMGRRACSCSSTSTSGLRRRGRRSTTCFASPMEPHGRQPLLRGRQVVRHQRHQHPRAEHLAVHGHEQVDR
jgi:hypothetical protein